MNILLPERNRLKKETDERFDSLPTAGIHGEVLIDDKKYLRPSAPEIPTSNTLFWMRDTQELASIMRSRLDPKRENYDSERLAKHVQYAKVPSKKKITVEPVVDQEGIQEAIFDYIQQISNDSLLGFPLIGNEGSVEIGDSLYVQIDLSTTSVFNMHGFTPEQIKHKIDQTPKERKKQYGKDAIKIIEDKSKKLIT